MDKCYFSQKHKKGRIINYVLTFLASITLCVIGTVVAISTHESDKSTPESDKYACFLLCLGLLILLYGILFDLFMYREYELSENGITIRYAKRKTVFFPWKCISQICICRIHQGKIESVRDDVIWCTVGKIKKGPPNMARRWNEAGYGFIHFHSVLTMEYTPERLADFKKYSNRDIPDYRDVIYR